MGLLRGRAAILALLLVAPLASGCLGGLGDRFNSQRDRFRGPGEAAGDFLETSPYKRLVVEVDHPATVTPNRVALDTLRSALKEATAKTTVEVVTGADLPARGREYKYSLREAADLEERHRDRHASGDTAVLYLLYLDGGFEADSGDARVLGVAYRGSSIALFHGNVDAATRPDDSLPIGTQPREQVVARAVLVHEAGHVLGLVNNGIPMVRPHEMTEDPVDDTPENEGRHHSSSLDSVMYYAVEQAAFLSLFDQDDIPYTFDSDDKSDMRAVRER